MKRIFILVNKYPNKLEPNVCVFIQQLVWSFADLGYKCSVIAPLPINLNIKYLSLKYHCNEINENEKVIDIFHPMYLSLGQSGSLFQKLRVRFTTFMYIRAINRVLKKQKLDTKNDIIYSHFICPSAVAAAKLGKKYNLKNFFAHGEATYTAENKYGNGYLKKVFSNTTGVIAVSTQNKNFLLNAGVVAENKIKVFPNGYRKERFYKIDKTTARKHMKWDTNKFIVGFCGSFDERKGILRLEKAVDKIDNVYFACAGKGELIPQSEKCILKLPVNNDELVYFYNAIDIFVLPTQNEGCCNAIVEAMACGCPIISSDREFNYDILDDSNAILVNPNDVDEIKNAIIKLKSNTNLMNKMSESSLIKSKKLTLKIRSKNIVDFIESKMK